MSVNSIFQPYPASAFSSPPSSPNPFTDSSPASSPDFACAYNDDADVPEITLPHPLAASATSGWRPPQYEKKRPKLSVSPPPERRPKKLKHASFDPNPETYLPSSSPVSPTFTLTPEQVERDKWDAASSRVVDDGHGLVTLDNENLTYIPRSFINDLNNFYTPPEDGDILLETSPRSGGGTRFARTVTAPPGQLLSETRTFSRSRSAAHASFGVPRDRIQLHLSNNFIRSLPLAIFRLENLSILALRSNKLTFIPPEINQLKHLHTLNISNNKLEYLPSEMLQMNLNKLLVNMNPFIPPPLPSTGLALTRPVSEPKYLLAGIPPLAELCLRTLLSPSPTNPGETLLEAQYDLPLDECPPDPNDTITAIGKTRCNVPIPFDLKQILYVGAPSEVSVNINEDDMTLETGVGICPSPHHKGQQAWGTGLFFRPAVERFTWERIVAGQSVGGLVPIKWRGCFRNCLDFLDPPSPETESSKTKTLPDEEDWDMEADGVVQVMDLGPSTFSDDEGFGP